MKKKVVITEKIHPDAMAMFAEREDIEVVLLPDVDPETIRREIADADAVLVRAAAIGQDVLEGASRLKVVSRHGVGCDKIATEYLGRRGVPVAIAAQANAGSVAEHVIMMMMVLNKQIFAYDPMTRRRDWAARGTPRTSELFGRTVLIVGFGRIGRRLAPICKAFGMRVVVTDIALDANLAASMGVESAVDFRPYLGEADYLTVHVPLKADTNPLIGAAELAALPPHAYVINCARGGVVDEQALAAAVREGRIAGTGSDVFVDEPPRPDNPLIDLPNSVLTPHWAASTIEGGRRMAVGAAENILDCFDGKLRRDHIFNLESLA